MVIYHNTTPVNLNTLLLIPGLFILYINSISFGMTVSIISARYRDMSQIIKSLIQIVFFITPIMWKPETLNERYHFIFDFNPFYAFLQLLREPLLGNTPTLKNFVVAFITTAIGFFISYKLFARYRARIVYWL